LVCVQWWRFRTTSDGRRETGVAPKRRWSSRLPVSCPRCFCSNFPGGSYYYFGNVRNLAGKCPLVCATRVRFLENCPNRFTPGFPAAMLVVALVTDREKEIAFRLELCSPSFKRVLLVAGDGAAPADDKRDRLIALLTPSLKPAQSRSASAPAPPRGSNRENLM